MSGDAEVRPLPTSPWDLLNWGPATTLESRQFVRLFGGKPTSLIHNGRKRRKA